MLMGEVELIGYEGAEADVDADRKATSSGSHSVSSAKLAKKLNMADEETDLNTESLAKNDSTEKPILEKNKRQIYLNFAKLKDDLSRLEQENAKLKMLRQDTDKKNMDYELLFKEKADEVNRLSDVESELLMENTELKRKLDYARQDMERWNVERLELLKSKKEMMIESESLKKGLNKIMSDKKD